MAESVLPHHFPFRLVDGARRGAVHLRLTLGAFWVRGGVGPPSTLAIEIVAQASALLLSTEGQGRPGYLAGVEEARWIGAPLAAGDDLEVRASLLARLGPVAKIAGTISRGGSPVFTVRLLVREE